MGKGGSVIFALCLSMVSGQYPLKDGKCPNFNDCHDTVELTTEMIANTWYVQYTISFFFQANMKCTRISFIPSANSTEAKFEITEYDNSTNEKRSTGGYLILRPHGNLELRYTELHLPFKFTTLAMTPNTWVLVACYDNEFFDYPPGIYGYVNSRLPFARKDAEAATALKKCGISIDAFLEHDQTSCEF